MKSFAWMAAIGVVLVGLAVTRGMAAVDHAPTDPVTLKMYWENDAPFYTWGDDTDRWYTNGTAIAIAWRPQFAEDLAGWLPFADQFDQNMDTAFGLNFGHQMYTPMNISTTALQANDHPYAAYLYGGAFLQRANDHTLEHFQIDVGVVGPSAFGDEIQNWVHDITDSTDANGWDNQLHDEITFQFIFRKKWRTDPLTFEIFGGELGFQAIPQVGIQLGTVKRQLEGDLTLRLGYQLPDDFGPGRLADLDAFTGDPTSGLSWYGFVRVGGRAIEHDLFLDGNNFRDSHFVTKDPFVGELQTGVNLQYSTSSWTFDAGYAMTWLTEQFEQANGHTHKYGAWTFSATYWFD